MRTECSQRTILQSVTHVVKQSARGMEGVDGETFVLFVKAKTAFVQLTSQILNVIQIARIPSTFLNHNEITRHSLGCIEQDVTAIFIILLTE